MTRNDALDILELTGDDDLDGATVRHADDGRIGDDADLHEVEEAAKLLGYVVEEDSDGALVLYATE